MIAPFSLVGLVLWFSAFSSYAQAADCEVPLLEAPSGNGMGIEVDKPYKPPYVTYTYWTAYLKTKAARSEIYELVSQLKGEKKLPKKQKKKIKKEIKIIEEKLKELHKQLALLEDPDRKLLLAYLPQALEQPGWKGYLFDYLRASRILSLDRDLTVSILAGNSSDYPSVKVAAQVQELATGLAARGYSIIYDAESKIAPIIQGAAPKNSIGISSKSIAAPTENAPKVTVIRNDYLRLLALEQGGHTVITPDSLVGVATLLHGRVSEILDPDAKWNVTRDKIDPKIKPWPKSWTDELADRKTGMGIWYGTVPVLMESAEVLGRLMGEKRIPAFPAVDGEKSLKNRIQAMTLNLEGLWRGQLQVAFEYARAMSSAHSRFSDVPGAVVLGSALLGPIALNQKIFNSSLALAQLGIPITTGGSAGFMRIANAAAYMAGGTSTGVPMAGRDEDSDEAIVYRDLHTQTVFAPNYSSRIPMLLQGRPVEIFVPGRGGTMKELAVAILMIARAEERPYIFFLDRGFYAGLHDELMKLPLPSDLLDRLRLVDSSDELQAEVMKLVESGKVARDRLQSVRTLTPRVLTEKQLEFLKDKVP